MNLVIIGSGNVATVLGRLFTASGCSVLQVWSPVHGHASALATQLGASVAPSVLELRRDADLYLLCVSDAAVYDLASVLSLGDSLVAHTAGAVPMSVLSSVSSSYGVLYPLQSLQRSGLPSSIPFLVDGSSSSSLASLSSYAALLSGVVRVAGDAQRLAMHVAGVLVNNFPNYLYTLTASFLSARGYDFSLLQPLILETASRLSHFSPSEVQTGPAVRGDEVTIERHMELLESDEELQEWYWLFSEHIRARSLPRTDGSAQPPAV